MAIVIAEPLAHYQVASPSSEPADTNDNGAGTAWAIVSCFIAASGRDGGNVVGSNTRGTYSIRLPDGHTSKTHIISAWLKWEPNNGGTFSITPLIASMNPALTSYNWVLGITQNGNLFLTGAGSSFTTLPLAYAMSPMTTNVWHHLELKVFQDNSSGTFELRLDGVTVMSATGFDSNTNTSTPTIRFTGNEETFLWEDILILDTTGSELNDFMGEMRYELVPVDGDGTIVNWTPTAGSNYQTIDEAIGSPDDGDYISSSTTDQDNYATHEDATAPGHTAIYFAQLMVRTQADADGERIALQVNSDGTVDRGPDQNLVNGTWLYRREAWAVDPDTGLPWTLGAINAAEWGVRKRV